MAKSLFNKAFSYLFIFQFFLAQTVWAVGWNDFMGESWNREIYPQSSFTKALRVEVQSTQEHPCQNLGGVSLYVHGLNHNKGGHRLLVNGQLLNFSQSIQKRTIRSSYEGGIIEFSIDNKGNVELLNVQTPYMIDLVTTGNLVINGLHTHSNIRIGSKSFQNNGIIRAKGSLKISTTQGPIENKGLLDAPFISLSSPQNIINEGGRIMGVRLEFSGCEIQNIKDGFIAGSQIVSLMAETLFMSKGSLWSTHLEMGSQKLHLENKSHLHSEEAIHFRGLSYKATGKSKMEAFFIEMNVGFLENLESIISSKYDAFIQVGEFLNDLGEITAQRTLDIRQTPYSQDRVQGYGPLTSPRVPVFSNKKGLLKSEESLLIDLGHVGLSNTEGTLSSQRVNVRTRASIKNSSGRIEGKQVKLAATSFLNTQGAVLGF